MNTRRLKVAASRAALEMLLSEEFSALAVSALEDGCDSPSLRALAELTAAESDKARTLFDRALAELGIDAPSKRDAVMFLARETATALLSGAITPHAGANQIWELSLRIANENLPQLHTFVYAASEWEDRPEDRQVFEDGITAAARDLVSA